MRQTSSSLGQQGLTPLDHKSIQKCDYSQDGLFSTDLYLDAVSFGLKGKVSEKHINELCTWHEVGKGPIDTCSGFEW